ISIKTQMRNLKKQPNLAQPSCGVSAAFGRFHVSRMVERILMPITSFEGNFSLRFRCHRMRQIDTITMKMIRASPPTTQPIVVFIKV
ncbi:hypothetical protein PFISCL1PPCAC_11204, partial [Pristionchus fissidentatus]